MMVVDALTRSMIQTAADERAVAEGCRFDAAAAERPGRFIRARLIHPNGPLYGQRYQLMEWQDRRILRPLFGWLRPDGRRRFQRAYIEVPKKNNKTGISAGIVDYLLAGEGGRKRGKCIYSAAADRKQAAMIFDDA